MTVTISNILNCSIHLIRVVTYMAIVLIVCEKNEIMKDFFYFVDIIMIETIMWWRCSVSVKECYTVEACSYVYTVANCIVFGSQYRYHNEYDGVSNHQPRDCLLSGLFRRRSKKASKLRVTGLCAGNSPVTGEFPAQRASNASSQHPN